MDATSLRGIAILTVEDGEKIGTVDTTLFDTQSRRVHAFRMSSGHVFGRSRAFLQFDRIRSVGTDAIMIPDRDVVTHDDDRKRFEDYPDASELSSLRVVTDNGTYAGNLETIHFDPETGAITEIEMSSGGWMGAFRKNQSVPIDDVRRIGRDVVIIPDHYVEDEEAEATGRPEHGKTRESEFSAHSDDPDTRESPRQFS